MSYVKNYEVGSAKLDAPYAHYNYELPLISFSDVRHNIDLSLVYQSKLSNDPFYIKNGFKLNLQKRLIMAYGTYPKSYEDCDGTLVSLNNFVYHFTFNDDSQRIIRYVNGQYVLENPDLSTEIYNSSGKIIAIKDKYGEEYLSYTYVSEKLTSINYCNSKHINLSYYNDGSYSGQLERIEYVCGEASFSSIFTYSNTGIKIQHYSGVDYHIGFSENTLTSYSSDRNGSYSNARSHKLICTLDTTKHEIGISRYIGAEEVDRITYTCLGVNSENKFIAVNITDFNGIITRVQYENDRPCYSYEVMDIINELAYEDIFFEDTAGNEVYKGDVSISTETFSGVQGVNDGLKMRNISSNTISSWRYGFSGTESIYGNFIISGWIHAKENKTYTITVRDIYRSVDYDGCILSNLVPNVWNYFCFKTYMKNPADIAVNIKESNGIPLCYDVRISFEEGKIYGTTDFNHFTITKDVLIKEGANSSNEKIIYFDNALRFYSGNSLITSKITVSDILKYKINQNKNRYLDEIYYDKCKGVSTNNGVFALEYDEDVNGVIRTTRVNIEDIAVGKICINNEKTYLTKMNFYFNSNGNFISRTYVNDAEVKAETYDVNFDIVTATVDNVTTTYERIDGLITSESISGLYTRTTSYYEDAEGNPTVTATDEFKKTTVYTFDPVWGVVKSITLPGGEIITDEYDDDMCANLKRTFGSNESSNSFSYSNGNLSRIQIGSLYYDFAYSGGNLSSVSKNGVKIEEHNITSTQADSYYPSKTSKIFSTSSTYDKYGRLTQIAGQLSNTYDVNPTYFSEAFKTIGIDSGSAKLAKSADLVTGEVTKYAYDNNRVSRVGVFSSSGAKLCEEVFAYDSIGRIKEDTCTYDSVNSKSVSRNIGYTKEADDPAADGMVKNFTYKIGNTPVSVATNGYDTFKRLTSKSVALGTNSFSTVINYEQTRVGTVTDKFASSTLGANYYRYDDHGRIEEITGTYSGTYRKYEYDSLGRLVRENNQALDKTFIYCYDSIGNITSVKSYQYTTAEVPTGNCSEKTFIYTDTQKDRLTKYGYDNISYNSIGYPTYCGERAFVWNNGKLVRLYDDIDENSCYSSEDIRFTYNAYGFRTSKVYSYNPGPDYSGNFTVKLTKNYYYDQSGKLIKETSTEYFTESASIDRELTYLYDESGIIGVSYNFNGINTKNFYYRKNLQGDVVAIYDSNGVRKAEYAYDAFGNCQVIYDASDTDIDSINPIRYRGYYYDRETKLYYCNARYYNPEWRRFISPDDTAYLDPDTPNGLNLYAYCNNDPVNYADPSGNAALTIGTLLLIGFVSGAAIGAASSVAGQYIANGFSWDNFSVGQLVLDTALGGVSGLLSMSTLGLGATFAANAGIGFVGAIGGHLINGSDFSKGSTWLDIGLSTVLGALVGVIGRKGALNAGYLNGAKQTPGFIRAAGLYDDVLTKAATGFYRTSGIAANALRLSHYNLVVQWNKMIVKQAGIALAKALGYGGIALLIGTAGKGLLYDICNDCF